jgi:hypothetical protein
VSLPYSEEEWNLIENDHGTALLSAAIATINGRDQESVMIPTRGTLELSKAEKD